MIKASYVGILLFALVVSGCEREIDYSELTPEELEILYQHGDDHLLPRLCEAYARWYLERPEEEWWMDGIEYRREVGDRFLTYCERAHTLRREKRAACYLRSYYQSLIEQGEGYLGEFIVYLKGCGSEETYRAFVEGDARIVALAEHAITALAYLGEAKGATVMGQRLGEVITLFRLYVEDLKQSEGKVVLLSDQASALVPTFEDVLTTLQQLEAVYEQVVAGSRDPSGAQDVLEKLWWLLPSMEHAVRDRGKVVFRVNTLVYGTEHLNKDLLLRIVDTLTEFKRYKEGYIRHYHTYLKEKKE